MDKNTAKIWNCDWVYINSDKTDVYKRWISLGYVPPSLNKTFKTQPIKVKKEQK